ncbi:MAG: hypothetical protein IPK03_11780 [Bacteroidetes bacterium]|nr:hypothetical protein [Bacteroidota bacterium]
MKFSEKSKIDASNFFQSFYKYFGLTKNDSFALYRSEKDNIGFTHYRYQQCFKGLPVFGGEYLLHEKNTLLVSANGNIYSSLKLMSYQQYLKRIQSKISNKNLEKRLFK